MIAGAGLAGGSLALRLAKGGARVALLDPAGFPRDKLCGEFLSPECWGVFDRLGLTEAVIQLGYHPIHRVRITTPRGRVLESEFTGADGLPGIGLSRAALDDLIVRTARAAGVTVLEKTRVKGPVDPRRPRRRGRRPARDGRAFRGARDRDRRRRRPPLPARPAHRPAPGPGAGSAPGISASSVTSSSPPAAIPSRPGPSACTSSPAGTSAPAGSRRRKRTSAASCPNRSSAGTAATSTAWPTTSSPANPVLHDLWRAGEPSGEWKTIADVRVQASTPTLPGILYVGDARGRSTPSAGRG